MKNSLYISHKIWQNDYTNVPVGGGRKDMPGLMKIETRKVGRKHKALLLFPVFHIEGGKRLCSSGNVQRPLAIH
jgi:hypothetical protein